MRAESLRRGRLLPNDATGMHCVSIPIVPVRVDRVVVVVAPVFCSYHHEVVDLHLTGVLCESS